MVIVDADRFSNKILPLNVILLINRFAARIEADYFAQI
jgi:hypothetical protein